ncbi:hypothetical protein JWV37_10345 [Sulfurospirillum sp. T05]|uniref:Uncharacterized protein n=1 Tax=Sulfurospirillum tamanense TaxID=2813362 RepID=A0ABS2WU63_9BACT|nr:hypothetical protein [Sulfurospirillum tamanensis]MBN2965181.1 hypothetical protein [Sulfurospirillum tamanensis]
MRKMVVLFFLCASTLMADYLLTHTNGTLCLSYYNNNHYSTFYGQRSDGVNISAPHSYILSVEDGYKYENGECVQTWSSELGIAQEDFNFLIALIACFTGFVTLFFMSYLALEVGKK